LERTVLIKRRHGKRKTRIEGGKRPVGLLLNSIEKELKEGTQLNKEVHRQKKKRKSSSKTAESKKRQTIQKNRRGTCEKIKGIPKWTLRRSLATPKIPSSKPQSQDWESSEKGDNDGPSLGPYNIGKKK